MDGIIALCGHNYCLLCSGVCLQVEDEKIKKIST
jgi:hypothetical protein